MPEERQEAREEQGHEQEKQEGQEVSLLPSEAILGSGSVHARRMQFADATRHP